MCVEDIRKAFENLPSKTSFWVGFVAAILALCTLGFFVLLGMMLKGNINLAERARASDGGSAIVANNPPADNGGSDDLTVPAGTVAPVTSRDHVRGAAGAKVTLIEYSDFECPFCHRFHGVMKDLMEAYAGKIKWVYRHFPLEMHAQARKMAEGSECAFELGGQDKFWQYADKLNEKAGLTANDLPGLAKEIGLDQKKFEDCLKSGKYDSYLSQSIAQGEAAGIQGTPGTVLITAKGEKQLIKGALTFEMMKGLIDKAL